MKKIFIIIAFLLINALVSFFIYESLFKDQNFVYFESKPREENELYGFFKVDGEIYYQVYTTTQINMENGLHYHKIDVLNFNK